MDVSVILLLALYRNQEFARVGYYVFTEYDDAELRENPPVKVDFEKVKLRTKKRLTKRKMCPLNYCLYSSSIYPKEIDQRQVSDTLERCTADTHMILCRIEFSFPFLWRFSLR